MTDTPENKRLSILGNLRSRREEIAEKLHLDLRVPNWDDPAIYVRYGAIDHAYIARSRDRIEKAKSNRRGELELESNVDLLIRACVAVYAKLEGDDTEYSLREGDPEGELTAFDPDLAENLGLERDATAREVVRRLFFTDGDIFSHAQKVVEFSGYREAEADEAIRGES